jgi:predicted NUDIX family NTP pyrophosphohydrolase
MHCDKTERWFVDVQAKGRNPRSLLVHSGGPLWAKKDLGAWSVQKGEYSNGEDALTTARREFEEETGI